MSGHTPGPWVAKELYGGNRGWVVLHEETINGGSFKRRIDWSGQMDEANARLIAAAPELLDAQTMGVEVNTPDFLDWMAERLIHVYGESPNIDFVLSLRERAKAGRAAIAKAEGAAP